MFPLTQINIQIFVTSKMLLLVQKYWIKILLFFASPVLKVRAVSEHIVSYLFIRTLLISFQVKLFQIK